MALRITTLNITAPSIATVTFAIRSINILIIIVLSKMALRIMTLSIILL
jgi:hypothetical protein